jgi:hypothetical protein
MQDLFILMFVVRKLDGLTIKGKTMELARDSKGRFISTKKGQTMVKTYTYQSQEDLVQAFSGNELYGLTPAEKYDATKFNYPIKVTVNVTKKTFTVKEIGTQKTETKTQEVVSQTTEKEPFYRKSWFPFAVVAAIIVVVAIVFAVA